MELAEEEDTFDVFGYLKRLRQSRRGLIESLVGRELNRYRENENASGGMKSFRKPITASSVGTSTRHSRSSGSISRNETETPKKGRNPDRIIFLLARIGCRNSTNSYTTRWRSSSCAVRRGSPWRSCRNG